MFKPHEKRMRTDNTVDTDYEQAAQQHRPQSRAGNASAARTLLAQGYSTHDVAQALRLTPGAVLDLLNDDQQQRGDQCHAD